MNRRKFITLVGSSATGWPLPALAQQPAKVPRAGVLWHAGSAEEEGPYFKGLIEGFASLGYLDGRTIRSSIAFPGG